MGLNRINKKNGEITYLRHQPGVFGSLQSDNIRSLAIDHNNRLWVGHTSGLDLLDTKEMNVSSCKFEAIFSEVEVSSIAVDCFNQIWAGTWFNGICRIRKDENSNWKCVFLKEKNPDYPAFAYSRIITVYADPQRSEVFFATGESLVQVFLDKTGNVDETAIFMADSRKEKTMSSNYICAIARESDSILWIGTIGGGLNKIKLLPNADYEAEYFSENEGLLLKDVESVQLDGNGNIWLGGNNLVKYNTKQHQFKEYITHGEVYSNSYKVGASYTGKDGKLYFGGINGVVYFDPAEIKDNTSLPHPDISDIAINNRIVQVQDQTILDKGISYTDKVKLHYDQNNITLYFTSLHFSDPGNCKFRYRLKGYEYDWHVTERGTQSVSYANLPYGRYTFELNASNNDGIWSKNTRLLNIYISPPWWLSLWAKILYSLLVICALITIYYYLVRWVNLKKKLEIKEIKEEQREKMHQIQLQFFTNISHEFRTPLTLILGSVEQMENELKSANKNYKFQRLKNNVVRLMKLINELMDFRKTEMGGFHLHIQQDNISNFIQSISADFMDFSLKENITFENNITLREEMAWFDPNILEKILLNLLNNAFKYTKEGGTVRIESLYSVEDYKSQFANQYTIDSFYKGKFYYNILIRDNGVGISEESIPKVFKRYYQVEDSEYDPHIGSGVGLALVKNLILLHKGRLTVFSERNKGTEFLVSIPCAKEDYNSDELVSSPAVLYTPEEYSKTPAIVSKNKKNKNVSKFAFSEKKTKSKILIVEDNEEVRSFFKESLESEYYVEESSDGMDALDRIRIEKPDFIICDWMMPRLNGYELCKIVKESPDTGYIPFIMLTAKDNIQSHIEGLEVGADAYLTKPVSMELLFSTIQNLYLQRKKIKEYLSSNFLNTAIDTKIKQKNKEFYSLLIKTIENNLENVNLDIDFLCTELSCSRTKLYQQVKEMTGLPIMELVRSLRLKKAIQLMAEEDIPIQEVMIRVGIQSQSYFTSFFKKEFGKTPGQFLKELKGE